MIGWVIVWVGGTAAGLLAYWDGQAGGFGTTGRGALLVVAVVVVAVVVVAVVVGGVVVGAGLPAVVRRVGGRRENRETEEKPR